MEGIIALDQSRDSVNALATSYRNKYLELEKKESKIDKDLKKNLFKINLGSAVASIGLLFTPKKTRGLGYSIVLVARPILRWKAKRNAKKAKKTIEKEKETLLAEYINAEGSSIEFETAKNYNIESIQEEQLLTAGMSI